MNTTDTTENAINARVTALYPRIQSAAGRVYANQAVPMVEQDDIAQEMALRILKRAQQIPDFADQKDAYLMIDSVRNGGIRSCESERIYTRHVEPDRMIVSDDDGFETTIIEVAPDSSISPEDAVIQNEIVDSIRSRVESLSQELKSVIALAVAGYSDAEIARKLGVNKSTITHRRETIRKKLNLNE